jgi:hypothetical protein
MTGFDPEGRRNDLPRREEAAPYYGLVRGSQMRNTALQDPIANLAG